MEEIVNTIASDIGLSAAAPKTTNSSFYGVTGSIGDIEQATMITAKNTNALIT